MIDAVARDHPGERVELWFMDEARVGQKGGLTHVWYQKGARPRGVRQQGFASTYLFGAVCPERGEGVAGLRDRPRPGRPCALDEGRQAALKGLILRGPRLERDGCVAWRARDLRGLVERRFGVGYSEAGIRRLLKGLDLSWQKARPVHPEADPKAPERFEKSCRT